MATCWEIAAHSAYNMFSSYKYLIVNLVYFPLRFLEWEFLSDCAFSCPLPSCTFLKVGFTWVYISRTIFPDVQLNLNAQPRHQAIKN